MSGLYLAELAPPDFYQEDPGQSGRILVSYKRNLMWAKPCLRLGALEAPSLSWVTRNWAKFKVWIAYEDQRVASSRQESLIWVGFMPVGGEANMLPDEAVVDHYPDILIEELGSWRILRNSVEGQESFELYKVVPDAEAVLTLKADGGSQLLLTDGNAIFSTPDGQIQLGLGADHPATLGDVNADLLAEIIDAVLAANVPTVFGPSGLVSAGSGAALLNAAKAKVNTTKSTFVFVAKDPA